MNLPSDRLPPADCLPDQLYTLPELNYSPVINCSERVTAGNVVRGYGARAAIRYQDQVITYAELLSLVQRLAGGFRAIGVQPGDRVLIHMADRPELLMTVLALQWLGAVAVPTYVQFRAADLVYRERDAAASLVVTAADLMDEVELARPQFQTVAQVVVWPEASARGDVSGKDLLAAAPLSGAHPTRRESPAAILYSSGSTGQPKGCIISHADNLAVGDGFGRYCLAAGPDAVFMTPGAIAFSFGNGFGLFIPLCNGSAVALVEDKRPEPVLRAIARQRVTHLGAVPTFYKMLLEHLRTRGDEYDISCLRITTAGGEPLPENLFNDWRHLTGLELVEVLGSTELAHAFLSTRRADRRFPGWIGQPVPGYQVVVRDADTFAEVPRGEPGILTVRGPTGTKYWNKPAEQRSTVRDGWNILKDIVVMNDDGYVRYIARSDDMIVSAGYNIPPADVENVIISHPAVKQVACVGAPDVQDIRSSIVKALVVLRPEFTPSDRLVREIQDHVRQNSLPYMYPRAVEFVAELPLTASGKIHRSVLRQREWRSRSAYEASPP